MKAITDFQGNILNLGDSVAFVQGLNILQRGVVTGLDIIRTMTMVQIVVENPDGGTTTIKVHSPQVCKLVERLES